MGPSLSNFIPRLLSITLTVVFSALTTGVHASAAPSFTWQAVTESNLRNIDRVGYFRDSNGVLHLTWIVDNASEAKLYYRTIDQDGNLSSIQDVGLSDWDALANPSIVVDSSGNRTILFSGLGPISPYIHGNVARVTRGTSESTWTLANSVDSEANVAYAADGISAALDESDAPYFSYAVGSRIRYGEQGGTETALNRGSCCVYESNIVRDTASNAMVLGWYSNVTSEYGLYMQQVLPTVGSLFYLDGSANDTKTSAVSISSRMPMTSRPDSGGVFGAYCAGYPSCDRVQVAQFGTDSLFRIPRSKKAAQRSVAITAGPAELMWVSFSKGSKVFLSRSKKANPKFTRPVSVKGPRGNESPTIWSIFVSAFDGGVDLLVQASPDSGGIAVYHARMTNKKYKKLFKKLKKKK